MWGAVTRHLEISSDRDFEDLISRMTLCVRDQLERHCYNTIGSFATFYKSFRKSGYYERSLEEFYRQYQPPIAADHYSCVGLSLDLAQRLMRLERFFPGVSSAIFLASCEEDIGNVNRYASTPIPDTHTSEKEHVVVALNIKLRDRVGVLVFDSGYHVAHPVVVMKDGQHPHTGWFKPGGTCRSRRFYDYTLHHSGRYVLWGVKEARNGVEQSETALIYTNQAFVSPVGSTERRNLVYNFKSLLKRDANGNVIAGIYFAMRTAAEPGRFTLFYRTKADEQMESKISFADVLHKRPIAEEASNVLRQCEQLLLPPGAKSSQQGLLELLTDTAVALSDAEFMQQLLDINQRIVLLSKNN